MIDRYADLRAALDAGPTPGPWQVRTAGMGKDGVFVVDEVYVYAPGAHDDVAIASDIIDPATSELSMANARHIAAAHPKAIRALLAERDQYARVLDGLPQDAIDGGWTAKGISAHAKALEAENERLRAVSQAVSDSFTVYERYGEICPFEGEPMIHASTLVELGELARAALQSQDREDAEVTAYALPGGISVERTMQRDGTCLWAVRDSFKNCLSKSGEWGYEPFPSSRTEEWLSAHRFNSASEAIGRARSIEGTGNDRSHKALATQQAPLGISQPV